MGQAPSHTIPARRLLCVRCIAAYRGHGLRHRGRVRGHSGGVPGLPRDPEAKLIASSWVIKIALSQTQMKNEEPWEVRLPPEERKRLKWTTRKSFMRLDGVLEAFLQTEMFPLKPYRCGRRQSPVLTHGKADLTECVSAPAGGGMVTYIFCWVIICRSCLPAKSVFYCCLPPDVLRPRTLSHCRPSPLSTGAPPPFLA